MGSRQIAENYGLHQRRAIEFRLSLHKATGATCLVRFVGQHVLHRLRNLVDNGHGNPRSVSAVGCCMMPEKGFPRSRAA
jgi:hypothetical protein